MSSIIHHTYFRNTFGVATGEPDWTELPNNGFSMNQGIEHLVSEANVEIPIDASRLDETDDTNVCRMFSEFKDILEVDGTTQVLFHGFIKGPHADEDKHGFNIVDPIGFLAKKYTIQPLLWEADTIKLGNADNPIPLVAVTEETETRYIPDPDDTSLQDAFIGGIPDTGGTNRRTWKAFGIVKDDGTQDTDPDSPFYFVDQIIPPGLYTIGTDHLNYIEFTGHTPQGNITIDFIIVYVEGTNQLEDMLLSIFTLALPDGLGLVNNIHYKTSGTYNDKTIWPSLITVNHFTWDTASGDLLKCVETILKDFAPPNYKVFWRHEKMMLFMGYTEITPHKTSTSYYIEGSYAYGGIQGVDTTPPFTNAYIEKPISRMRSWPRDELTHATKVIVQGKNEWPGNKLAEPSASIEVIPDDTFNQGLDVDDGGYTEHGTLKTDVIDMSVHTSHYFESDYNPSDAHVRKYWPLYFVDLGEEKIYELIRFVTLDSDREFKFGFRFEVCSDNGTGGYDPNASWVPAHSDWWAQLCTPFTEYRVELNGVQFRYCRISCKPAKTASTKHWKVGLTDIQFIERQYVFGSAEIIKETSPVGTWSKIVGTGEDDGERFLNMPNLYDQHCSRDLVANKLVVGHRTALEKDFSLANTNACAYRAAQILDETVRDNQIAGHQIQACLNVTAFRTLNIIDPIWGINRKYMIENFTCENNIFTLDLNSFSNSAWTDETPLTLTE